VDSLVVVRLSVPGGFTTASRSRHGSSPRSRSCSTSRCRCHSRSHSRSSSNSRSRCHSRSRSRSGSGSCSRCRCRSRSRCGCSGGGGGGSGSGDGVGGLPGPVHSLGRSLPQTHVPLLHRFDRRGYCRCRRRRLPRVSWAHPPRERGGAAATLAVAGAGVAALELSLEPRERTTHRASPTTSWSSRGDAA
jgi:hypothetical protein